MAKKGNPAKGKVTTTKPKGLYPEGSTRPIRDNPDKMAATDTPIEVPVYVYYERHMSVEPMVGKSRSGKKLTDVPPVPQLLGWTVTVDCFTWGHEIKVKLGRDSEILEVWDGNVKLATVKGRRKVGQQIPPITLPRFGDVVRPEAEVISHSKAMREAPKDDDPIMDDDDDFEEE